MCFALQVCDESKALLNAIIWAFTPFLTVEQYANSCSEVNTIPQCYIRIDVAHFIKGWSSFLSIVRPRIKEYYLASIGILIVCTDLVAARAIIKAILITASSETIGEKTPTLNAGEELLRMLTTEERPDLLKIKDMIFKITEKDTKQTKGKGESDTDEEMDEQLHEESEKRTNDFWQNWKAEINTEVCAILKAEVDERDNPRFYPEIANRLLSKIDTIALWGNVSRNFFGYGRIPASSAAVEGEFNLIKTHILNKKSLRVDLLVENLIKQDQGRLAIFEENVVEKPAEERCDRSTNSYVKPEKTQGKNNTSVSESSYCEETNENQAQSDHSSFESPAKDFKLSDLHNESVTTHLHDSETNYIEETNVIPAQSLTGVKCIVCKQNFQKNVLSEDLEICITCLKDENMPERLALQEREDWRGKGHTPKKRKTAMYLGDNKLAVKEALQFEKHRKIPILKNGNNFDLKLVTLANGKVSVTNTCAFDSIFQIVLAAATDSSRTQKFIDDNKNENKLYHLVHDTMTMGLRAATYRFRAEALVHVAGITIEKNKIKDLNCSINIGTLFLRLFNKTPSFRQISKCSGDCEEKKIDIIMPSADDDSLFRLNFSQNAIKNIIPKAVRPCVGCKGKCFENIRIYKIGKFNYLIMRKVLKKFIYRAYNRI